MKVTVSGHGFDLGSSLSEYITDRVLLGVQKYLTQALGARVSLSKEGRFFHVDVIVNSPISLIKASGESSDPYLAFDNAFSKISLKLRRYKDRLKEHKSEAKCSMKFALHHHEYKTQGPRAILVKEEKIHLRQLSLEEAIMHMDLMALPAFVFINLETNKLNIIHKEDSTKETIVLLDTNQEFKEAD